VDHAIPHSQWLNWSAEDRAKTVAMLMDVNERCQMCGTAEWEWQENRFAYEPVEKRCQGCYLKAISSEDHANSPGVHVTLVPGSLVTEEMRLGGVGLGGLGG
jgi:hypothetical protein